MSTRGVQQSISAALANNIISEREARGIVDKAVYSNNGNLTPVTDGEVGAILDLYDRITGPTTMEAPAIRAGEAALTVLRRFLIDQLALADDEAPPAVTRGPGEDGSYPVTLAIPEEGEPMITTLAMGEEDGAEDEPIYTTMQVGEEDGLNDVGDDVQITSAALGEEDGISKHESWDGVVSSLSMQVAGDPESLSFEFLHNILLDGESIVTIGTYQPDPSSTALNYSFAVPAGPTVPGASTQSAGDFDPSLMPEIYVIRTVGRRAAEVAVIANPAYVEPTPAVDPMLPGFGLPTFEDVRANAYRILEERKEAGQLADMDSVLPSRGQSGLTSIQQGVFFGELQFEVFASTSGPVAMPPEMISEMDVRDYYIVDYRSETPQAVRVSPEDFLG